MPRRRRKKILLKDVRRAVRKHKHIVSADEALDCFRRSDINHLWWNPLDSQYIALPRDTWRMFLDYSGVDRIHYKSETLDCDDFAVILAGECKRKLQVNGIGIVADFSGGHAYNCLLEYENGNLNLIKIEPQSDQLVVGHEGMYAGEQGFVFM